MSVSLDPNLSVNILLTAAPVPRAGFGVPLFIKRDPFSGMTPPRVKTYASRAALDADASEFTADELDALRRAFGQNPRASQIKVGAWDVTGSETIEDALAAIQEADSAWYGLCPFVLAGGNAAAAAALIDACVQFAAANGKFVFASVPEAVAFDGSDDLEEDIEDLGDEGYESGIVVVNSAAYGISLAARMLSFDLDSASPPYFAVVLAGFSASDIDEDQRSDLEDANLNYVGVLGGSNALAQGVNLNGRPAYVINTRDWFAARVREDFAQLLLDYSSLGRKLVIDDAGISAVRGKVDARGSQGIGAGHFSDFESRFPGVADVLAQDLQEGRIRGEATAQIAVGGNLISLTAGLTIEPIA